MPSEGAGLFPVAFGDFMEGYQVIDLPRISVLRDPFTTKGQVFFYSTRRVGGDVVNFDAIKIQECAV